METLITTVQNVKKYDNKHILLNLKLPKKLNFKPGQFVMIEVDGEERPFSIASPASQDNLEFLIAIHKGGEITPDLYKLKKGDELKIIGPYGTFEVDETDSEEIIFISAGTGVAPFRSMITDVLEKHPEKKVTLFFGFRENLYFEEEFNELKKKYKNFNLHVSKSGTDKSWKGLTGHVTEHIVRIIKSCKGKEVYICGPKEMVNATKKILIRDLKFSEDKIHVEKWD